MNEEYNQEHEELTVVGVLQDLESRGYTFDFANESTPEFVKEVVLAHRSQSLTTDDKPLLVDLYVRECHRIEGMSDPSDNWVIYAIETKDGVKGHLLNAYGVYSEEKQVEQEAVCPQDNPNPLTNVYDNTKEVGTNSEH